MAWTWDGRKFGPKEILFRHLISQKSRQVYQEMKSHEELLQLQGNGGRD
jgi:hypothetical protein